MKSSVATPKLSVIVPVYNAEKYLTHCVNSILAQEFESFELLLIDDGSADASATMCDEYAAKDERIRVFHQPNGGVSVARNMGLKNAKGGWISFVDSDDTIESEHFKNLMEHADEVDWVQTGVKDIDSEGKIIRELEVNEIFFADSSEEDNIVLLPRFGFVTNKIFNADILVKNNIQFRPWLNMQEDKDFIFDYLKCTNSFIFLPNTTYHYRYNDGSLSRQKYYTPSVFLDVANALDSYVNDDCFGIKTHEYIAQFVSKFYFRSFCSCLIYPISKIGIKKRLNLLHCILKKFFNSRLIKVYGFGTTKYLFWALKYYAKKLLLRFKGSWVKM